MKKNNILLKTFITTILLFIFSGNVFAASGSLSVSANNVYVGDKFTVTVNVSSAAAWNIHVTADGPVSACSINEADVTTNALDTNKTFTATCTTTGEGTVTLRLSGDVTSASDGEAVELSSSKSVVVSKKPEQPNNNNNNNNGGNVTDNRSKNNNLKEISIEGFQITKVDNNNYTLSVSNDVTSINIKATAEDSKAKVTGAGNHDLKVGENEIEIVVTAENGSQNKIIIKVTRKDGYYIEDLDSVLKNDKINDVNINVGKDTKISSSDIAKIKNSKKTVKLNYYDENKALVYSWIIDGSKINESNSELLTTIVFDSSNKKDILRLSNYADGLFASLNEKNNLSSGTKLKLYVGNKYNDKDLVNVYSYAQNSDKLEIVGNKIPVTNGFVEFDVIGSSDYFVTMSTVASLVNDVIPQENKITNILPMIIGGVVILILVIIIIILVLKNKKNNKLKSNDNNNNISSVENNNVNNSNEEENSAPINFATTQNTINNSVSEVDNMSYSNNDNNYNSNFSDMNSNYINNNNFVNNDVNNINDSINNTNINNVNDTNTNINTNNINSTNNSFNDFNHTYYNNGTNDASRMNNNMNNNSYNNFD